MAQPSTSEEDLMTPPILLDSITVENPPSENNAVSSASESDLEIESDDDMELETDVATDD